MTSFSSGDALNAVVADVGQYATKIGFAGEDYPRSYFRSNVAVLREEATYNDSDSSKSASREGTAEATDSNPQSKLLQSRRRIKDVCYDFYTRPICSNGQPDKPEAWDDGAWECANPVDTTTGLWYDPGDHAPSRTTGGADWNDLLQVLIRHGFTSALGTETDRHPLLLVERSYNPPPLRQQVLECLFEDLNVPAVFLARDATMACYACGRTTGTVVDIGYGGTTVTPVYEGYVEQKGIRRSPAGALHMDELIVKALDQIAAKNSKQSQFMPLYQIRRPNHAARADPFHRLARLHVAQQCREEGAGAAVDTTATAAAFATPRVPFQLPDGQVVHVPSAQRFAIANLVLGMDNNDHGTSSEASQREEIYSATKTQLSSYIAAASNAEEEVEEGDNHDDTTASATKRVYTEATAVGISSRRTRSTGSAAAKAQQVARQQQHLQQRQQQRRAFSNRLLQKACVPYLQAHLDQQLTSSPLANMVCDAAFRCDRDQQASLLGNVILGGGGACLGPTDQSVPDQLRAQVEAIIHTHTPGWRVKVLSPSIQERSICSWLGGSILASLGTFHDMWITRAEYEEWGPAIVNRKCP